MIFSQGTAKVHLHADVRNAVDADITWLNAPVADLLVELGTTGDGLSHRAAVARLRRDGPNLYHDEPQRSQLRALLKRFANPLVIILIVASAIAGATGETASFVIIIAMVLLSVILDYVQEYRAGKAADRLRQAVLVRVKVLRDGTQRELPVARLVAGDIIELAAGAVVPADGRLIEAANLYVNQVALTGEPYPVAKRAGDPESAASGPQDANHAAYMGTAVVSGYGRLLVCRTGARTAMGQVATAISAEPEPTAFERGTRRFGMLIMRLTVFMVLFVLFANAFTHKPWLDSFLFAIALAVGLTPELLPMIVSVTLARGATVMARKDVIVKRLSAIEDLGAMDVLCTDKTGTLTAARIHLEKHLAPDGSESERVLFLAWLNSHFESGIRTPMDEAILAHTEVDAAGWQKLDEVPFDFERRRVSVLVGKDDARQLIVKGAPEDLLARCTTCEAGEGGQGPATFDAVRLAAALNRCSALAAEGYRVLAVAWKPLAADAGHVGALDERDLVFAGFAAFLDPPKKSAPAALKLLDGSGVEVKIVTGDGEEVTRHVCGVLGIAVRGVISGKDLATIDDAALATRVESANLFCRVSPAQKARIVAALQARGHVVGFLGDGINDAPALHAADIGLSVDSAVDVAKEAADMILLKNDLGVLHAGVMEGRRTFVNIRKYIMMGTSSNFGNMFSMAGASLFLPFLAMLPTQILLNNILYDLSEVPIPLDAVEEKEIEKPQRWDLGFIRNFMLVLGPVSSLFDFLTFYILLQVLHAPAALFQTGWFMESLATQVLVIFVIRTRGAPFGLGASVPGKALVATSLIVVTIAGVLPFTAIGRYFGFVPPPAEFLAVLATLVVMYLLLAEVVKRVFYRYFGTA